MGLVCGHAVHWLAILYVGETGSRGNGGVVSEWIGDALLTTTSHKLCEEALFDMPYCDTEVVWDPSGSVSDPLTLNRAYRLPERFGRFLGG